MGTERKTARKVIGMIFVDSNMWCYYFDQRLSEHKQVRESMREIIRTEKIACNTIVIMEVAHYVVRHFNEEEARKKITSLVNLRNLQILDFDRALMRESLESLLEHYYAEGLGGRDATIVASLKSQDIKRIATHDAVFKRLAPKKLFEVIDPAEAPPE
jgi:predicted nucleic acid-binding protein